MMSDTPSGSGLHLGVLVIGIIRSHADDSRRHEDDDTGAGSAMRFALDSR
jgi:hypothetical protein